MELGGRRVGRVLYSKVGDGSEAWPARVGYLKVGVPGEANVLVYKYTTPPPCYSRSIMADEEVATKAPESDAQESVVAGDTSAQKGPSMGV